MTEEETNEKPEEQSESQEESKAEAVEEAAEKPTPEDDEPEDDSDLHPLQKLLDNPWLLLVLGVVIPTLSYTAWAWIELMMMTEAKLP